MTGLPGAPPLSLLSSVAHLHASTTSRSARAQREGASHGRRESFLGDRAGRDGANVARGESGSVYNKTTGRNRDALATPPATARGAFPVGCALAHDQRLTGGTRRAPCS